ALEQLTLRRDLRFLTMLTFTNVLSSRGLFRFTQAWCPACYEEWKEADQVIYQPLLWTLEVIQVCPRHGLLLHLRCPYTDCEQALSALTPRSQLGYCAQCERWLGRPFQYKGSSQGLGIKVHERQQWTGTIVGELLAAAPALPAPPEREVIADTISRHVQAAMEGNFSAFARYLQVHRRTAWEWGQGLQVPQLRTLLQLCSYFDTSPLCFFRGHALENAPAHKHILEEKRLPEKHKKRPRKFETVKLRSALQEALQGEENPPPSMREVARRLRYDSSHLYKHFPDLCRAIAARYRAHQKEQRRLRLQRICDEVQQAAQTLYAQGYIPSERQVGKSLQSRGVLKEDEVRAALFSARAERR
ncbi:MAG TPA: TniQ family protein, partial [Ktedonobacteraceae bacterium]